MLFFEWMQMNVTGQMAHVGRCSWTSVSKTINNYDLS